MKILICPDKFKECLSASEVAYHLKEGIMSVLTDAECLTTPLADGGEGTVETVVSATGGKIVRADVHDPLMRKISSSYGISGDEKTAVIEMSAASGLFLLKPEERSPMKTTTFGTGELIMDALDRGCKEIILGIGGSATVDGGVGMAQALGFSFKDSFGNEVESGGGNIGKIKKLDASGIDHRIFSCNISVACDVKNKLTGKQGAAYFFGPQKGASPEEVKELDKYLSHLSDIILNQLNINVSDMTGGGAAGGLGAGVVAFMNGSLIPGFELISSLVNLEQKMKWADVIITGEGKMDLQTSFGKTPYGVAEMALKFKKPVIAVTGLIDGDNYIFQKMGFSSIIPIADKPMTIDESITRAGTLLEATGMRLASLLKIGQNLSCPSLSKSLSLSVSNSLTPSASKSTILQPKPQSITYLLSHIVNLIH